MPIQWVKRGRVCIKRGSQGPGVTHIDWLHLAVFLLNMYKFVSVFTSVPQHSVLTAAISCLGNTSPIQLWCMRSALVYFFLHVREPGPFFSNLKGNACKQTCSSPSVSRYIAAKWQVISRHLATWMMNAVSILCNTLRKSQVRQTVERTYSRLA